MEFTLLGAALLGAAGFYAGLWIEGRRDATICVRDLWAIGVTAAVAGLAVGRLAAKVIGGTNPLANPGDILIVRGGVDTGIAAVAALVTVAVAARRDLLVQADALAAPALAGLAGWHAGCLVRGACLGTPSRLPWAYPLPGSELPRHPVELYAAGLFLVVALVLGWWRLRFPAPGMVAAAALALAGAVRLATQPFRPSLGGGPTAWYWAAVAAGVAGVGTAVLARRRRREPG